jgi:hypothetical protein
MTKKEKEKILGYDDYIIAVCTPPKGEHHNRK